MLSFQYFRRAFATGVQGGQPRFVRRETRFAIFVRQSTSGHAPKALCYLPSELVTADIALVAFGQPA